MTTAIAIAFICLYAVLDGLADAFIFREWAGEKAGYGDGTKWAAWAYEVVGKSADMNTNWHRAQAAQQSAVILATAYLSGCWQIVPLGAALFWLIHDGIVNRIGLDRPFFFVGTTAWIDRQFQRFKKPELAMGVAKAVLILAGVSSFFVKF